MYTLYTISNIIIRSRDGASIPVDILNTDYQEYMAWVSAGNTPITVNK